MEKIWIKNPETKKEWLVKYPSEKKPLDAVNEKICSELAKLLGLRTQRVELCIDDEHRIGCICENFLAKGESLVHGGKLVGVELNVDGSSPLYEKGGTEAYTLQLILSCLNPSLHQEFINTVLFDNLVGNVDRHDKNWGLVGKSLAPMFDYGLSFFETVETESTWFQMIAWKQDDGSVLHNKLFEKMLSLYNCDAVMRRISDPDFDKKAMHVFDRCGEYFNLSKERDFFQNRRSKMLRLWKDTGKLNLF